MNRNVDDSGHPLALAALIAVLVLGVIAIAYGISGLI